MVPEYFNDVNIEINIILLNYHYCIIEVILLNYHYTQLVANFDLTFQHTYWCKYNSSITRQQALRFPFTHLNYTNAKEELVPCLLRILGNKLIDFYLPIYITWSILSAIYMLWLSTPMMCFTIPKSKGNQKGNLIKRMYTINFKTL